MSTYNGHPSWDHWNVALWFGNDEPLYRMARSAKDPVALANACDDIGYAETLDGAVLTSALIEYAWESVQDE